MSEDLRQTGPACPERQAWCRAAFQPTYTLLRLRGHFVASMAATCAPAPACAEPGSTGHCRPRPRARNPVGWPSQQGRTGLGLTRLFAGWLAGVRAQGINRWTQLLDFVRMITGLGSPAETWIAGGYAAVGEDPRVTDGL